MVSIAKNNERKDPLNLVHEPTLLSSKMVAFGSWIYLINRSRSMTIFLQVKWQLLFQTMTFCSLTISLSPKRHRLRGLECQLNLLHTSPLLCVHATCFKEWLHEFKLSHRCFLFLFSELGYSAWFWCLCSGIRVEVAKKCVKVRLWLLMKFLMCYFLFFLLQILNVNFIYNYFSW